MTLGASRAGRTTILAHAVGTESFIDNDGDGLFDTGETFVDLPEAFLDKDEDTLRDTDEEFIDFNINGSYDVGDGKFNGTLCDSGGGVPAACPGTRTLNVRRSLVLVMSGSSPVIDATTDVTVSPISSTAPVYSYNPASAPPTISIPNASTTTISVVIRDVNDEPMPSGTTIAFTVFGGGELLGTSNFVVPSMNDDSALANTYGITYKGPSIDVGKPNNEALVELAVTSPSGVKTVFTIKVITRAP